MLFPLSLDGLFIDAKGGVAKLVDLKLLPYRPQGTVGAPGQKVGLLQHHLHGPVQDL